jgi:hypothetical protein
MRFYGAEFNIVVKKKFRFYLELYKNIFKNLILISKFKFSFRGLNLGLSFEIYKLSMVW